jgi:hypothetical protein
MTGMVVAKPSPLTDPASVPPFRDRIVAVWHAALALRLGLHPDLGHQCHVFGMLAEASFTFGGAATQPPALKLALATRTRDVPSLLPASHWRRWQIAGIATRHQPPLRDLEGIDWLRSATASIVCLTALVGAETAGVVTARCLVGITAPAKEPIFLPNRLKRAPFHGPFFLVRNSPTPRPAILNCYSRESHRNLKVDSS